MKDEHKAVSVLTMNTLAFLVCFACWVMYGVLITFLVDNGLYSFDAGQVGLLIGTPVLTGSILRLPLGVLTDKFGGRIMFIAVMLISAIAMYSVSFANSFTGFLLAGLGFGLAGASFAVGVAYTSAWFPISKQGTALGIFGAGNTGAALTSVFAPMILMQLTGNLQNLDNWRMLPKLYAGLLVAMTVLFFFFTHSKKLEAGKGKSLKERLSPLREVRVWRFGLYYFLVFGAFVALSQWLIPYYVNVYGMSLATAGLLAAAFSLPAGIVRSIGGWMADRWGARRVMYAVLSGCAIFAVLLSIPRLDLESPGEGIMAAKAGVVTRIEPGKIVVDGKPYALKVPQMEKRQQSGKESLMVLPRSAFWHEALVQEGDHVAKKQLLAKGVTHIHFQANIWIFTGLVFLLGTLMGIGSAAVFKYIPDYYPQNVGVVGGIVGVIGGLGGFLLPIIFGQMLKSIGLWTTNWMFLTVVSVTCLGWLWLCVSRMRQQPGLIWVSMGDIPASKNPKSIPLLLKPEKEMKPDE
jgi:NNP family nitrate/nitrite transporter-like MFS transporter